MFSFFVLSLLPPYSQDTINDNPDSSQARALEWLAKDPNFSSYAEWRVLQRFALATIYYATEGETWYESTDWLSYNVSECEWLSSTRRGHFCLGGLNGLSISQTQCSLSDAWKDSHLLYPEEMGRLQSLSLASNGLKGSLPAEIGLLTSLRIIDLSNNKLISVGRLHLLKELKSLNLDGNKLLTGSLGPLSSLNKLQTLSVKRNKLGKSLQSEFGNVPPAPLPALPASLKQLHLAENPLGSIPDSLLTGTLVKLELLDLSHTGVRDVPLELVLLTGLQELRLDDNQIAFLPPNMGQLKKLKVLSLRNNQFTVASTIFTERNPQPLPKSLFVDTPLIDLNLHGNKMTNTQLNLFEGFQEFLDRRQKVKSKTLTNLDVCGLE